MRSLRLFALVMFFMSSTSAHASYAELSISASQSPPLNFDQNVSSDSFTAYSTQLTAGEIKLFSALSLNQIVSISRIDKSQFGFLDVAQKELYSKDTFTYALTGTSQLSFQSGHYSTSLSLLYPLSTNFVNQYGFESTQAFDLYNKSTIFGVGYKYLKELRPKSHFLDFDFTVKDRPSDVNAHEVSIFYEQLLSESFKFRMKPFLILRPEERPDARGAELLLAYTPFSGHFLKLKGTYAQEEKRQSLKNERGYFSLFSANLAWDYEINYGTIAGFSYNYQREEEENPRNLTTRTLGLDSISAFVEKKISLYTIKLLGDYSRSNLNSNFWGTTLSIRREL